VFFVACNNSNDKENGGSSVADIGPRPVYDIPPRERPVELFPELVGILYRMAFHDNGLYVYGVSVNEPDKGRQLFFCNIDDGSITSPFSVPPDFSLDNLISLSDGSLLISGYPTKYDENNIPVWMDDNYQIYHLTSEDTQLLIQGNGGMHVSNAIAIDEQGGRIFVLSNGYPSFGIYAYSIKGEFLYEVKAHNFEHDIIFSADTI